MRTARAHLARIVTSLTPPLLTEMRLVVVMEMNGRAEKESVRLCDQNLESQLVISDISLDSGVHRMLHSKRIVPEPGRRILSGSRA
jgi:hypothetical protein